MYKKAKYINLLDVNDFGISFTWYAIREVHTNSHEMKFKIDDTFFWCCWINVRCSCSQTKFQTIMFWFERSDIEKLTKITFVYYMREEDRTEITKVYWNTSAQDFILLYDDCL